MTHFEKTTHVEEGLDLLAQVVKGKPNLDAWLTVFLDQIQDLEHAYHSIFELTPLPVAEGVQLDGYGAIVGEPRDGRSDVAYRTAIQAHIRLNVASGTITDMIDLARATLGDVEVQVTEDFPAHFDLSINDPITPNPARWLPLTVYAVGDRVSSLGNVYECTTGGTSAASGGPSGTGSGIVDGTVVWGWISPGVGSRAASLILSGKPAGVRGIVRWFETTTPFVFDGGTGGGFGVGEFADAHDF